MANRAREAESDALNKLFGQMNRTKEIDAEKRRLQKEVTGDKDIAPAQTELQAPPTQAHPIVSSYLEKKKQEEAEQARIDKEKREKALADIQRMEQEAAAARAKAAKEKKVEEKKTEEKKEAVSGIQLTDVTPISKQNSVPAPNAPVDTPAKAQKESDSKKTQEQKPVVTEKAKPKGGLFGVFGGGKKEKAPENKKVSEASTGSSPVSDVKSEPKVEKEQPVQEKKPDSNVAPAEAATTEQPDKPVQKVPIKKAPVAAKTGTAEQKPEPKAEPKAKTKVETKAETKEAETRLMARGNSGMKLEKPKEDKLPITAIIPMKSDRGSRYDSAMKASNAFRTNVYLSCIYNDSTKEGAYGLVVDMGDKRIIHGMCGHTSDEWEYGFAGAIEAMRICRENNVKEIMFVVLDPLCEILQQNADGLRWGYSYTRSQFSKAISSLKQDAAIGFIPEKLENDFQDLAETIAKTLVAPTQQ